MINKQYIRLRNNKLAMLAGARFVVLHAVAFRTTSGKNVVIGGLSGSGKSYVFSQLSLKGIVAELYDEDLIRWSSSGVLSPLGRTVFKGCKNGEYIYEHERRMAYGKLDYMFVIDGDFEGFRQERFTNDDLLNFFMHEKYQSFSHLAEIYSSFHIPGIDTYYRIGNKNHSFDPTSLISLIYFSPLFIIH